MKTAPAALLVLLLAVSLGGCSDDDAEPSATPSSSAAPESPATEGVISPRDLPDDPEFTNKAQGVISDVEVETCDTEPGEVEASGTATNSGKFARDVVVVVSWTVGATGDVVAKGIAAVEDLEPGDSGDWTVTATVPGSTTAACVPTALAGQLKD